MAKVFVGIPTFNRPDWVRDAIASVLAQHSTDIRIVVSDNCSDGDVGRQIQQFIGGLGDARVSFAQQTRNGGEYGQGRYFLDAAAADELFMILHDDDVLEPGYLDEAVAMMDAHREAAFFVANAYAMAPNGQRSDAQTLQQLRFLGRVGVEPGLFDVLDRHLACGFAPISGTLFRRADLVRSGFVDDDCEGNYPFECNVFLRLGENGCKAWFSNRELMGVRYHPGALRSQRLLEDPALVATAIRIFARRRFHGAIERRRRMILARYYRAQAMIAVREGNIVGARTSLWQALRTWPGSPRCLLLALVVWLMPGQLRRHGLART